MAHPPPKFATAGSAISGSVELRGAKELNDILEQLPAALAKGILRKAMREAARPILKRAKENCPVDSGELRRSLKIRAIKRNSAGRVGVVVSTDKGFFKGDTFYGAFLEFGTSRMPARPYIRPAFDTEHANSIRIVGEEIAAGLNKAAPDMKRLGKLPPDFFLPPASDEDYESWGAP